MTLHRVHKLRLQLRSEAGYERSMETAAARFAQAALEQAADLVEEYAPGRRIFLRRLPVHWRIGAHALDDPAAIARCAEDLAEVLAALPATHGGVADDEIVVFEDEAHWRVEHLRARARSDGAGAWLFEELEQAGNPVEVLCRPERRELAISLLARLAREEVLVEVLTAIPPEDAERLAKAVIGEALQAEPPNLSAPLAAQVVEPLQALALEAREKLPPAVLALVLHTQARLLLGPAVPQAVVRAAVAAVLDAGRIPREPSAQATFRRPSASATPDAPWPARVEIKSGPPDTPRLPSTPERAALPAGLRTQFGGLFYLLTLALELEIGETLWKSGPPEGEVLAAVTAELLGSLAVGDPAPTLFGGVASVRCPPITLEQHAEVAPELTASLLSAIPHRGLAQLPEVMLSRPAQSGQRFLVVTALDSPFVLFAFPLAEPRVAEAAVQKFLKIWPPSAPPVYATRGLVQLDNTGRLAPINRGNVPFMPTADSPPATALLAQICGSLCYLFAARTQEPMPQSTSDFVTRYLMVPARVAVASESLKVTLPANRVSLVVRRAGLDKNPGWVPWLRRSVQLQFEGNETENLQADRDLRET